MSRPQRLFDLISILKSTGNNTVARLADDLGVSPRTIHRDLVTLQDVGAPIVTEPGRYGGVTLLPGGRFPVSGLSTREKDLLRVTGLDVDRAAELGVAALAATALGKLGTARTRDRLGPLSLSEVVTIDNHPWFTERPDHGDVSALADDVRKARRLSIAYRRSGEHTSENRIVDPYGLLGRGGRWYLVADRDSIPRLYTTSRLESWAVLDEPRRLRPGQTLDSVVTDMSEALEQPREQIIVTADLERSRLDIARRILGSRLTEVTERDNSGNGSVRISVAYSEIGGVRQLLQFGNAIQVIQPPEARALVAAQAKALLDRHNA